MAPGRVTIIEPARTSLLAQFREVLTFRELLYFFIWRDVKIRYKQTAFGAAWAVLQPVTLMIVFSVFLGFLARVPSEGFPYPVFVYSALVPWTLFSQALLGASESLVTQSNLVSKIYFPRILLPLAAALSFAIDLSISLLLMVVMMVIYGIAPSWNLLSLPLLVLVLFMIAIAIGTWFSAVNVKYRDVKFTVPLLLQIWLFMSPVAYPSDLIPESWRALYYVNPMAAVIDGFRWALIGADPPPLSSLLVSGAVALVVLVGSLLYFFRHEQAFADVI